MDNNFYVYIWYIVDNGYVFYVGKGHANRCNRTSKRNKTFNYYLNNFNCANKILESNLSEEDAFNREIYYISYYKSIGMADANYHKGGESGGNVFEYMPEQEKDQFINKMTQINRERCSSEEFREAARERMIARYEDQNERELQRKKITEAWEDENLRKEQSKKTLNYYKTHPEFAKEKAKKLCKRCAMELNGEIKTFDSKKELFKYLKDECNLSLDRKTEQKLFNEGIVYQSDRKSYMNGMKLYYV